MSLSQSDVVGYIKNLKLGEVKSLIEALENELGVKAAAPVAAVAAGPAAAAAAPVEEKTEFDVVMTAAGDKKLDVIKAVRELVPALGLKEAKALVESAPAKVKEGVSKADAEKAKAVLTAAGATVEIK